MSGINSRLIHDVCAIDQATKTLCANANYSLFLDYNVNPKMRTPKDVVCATESKSVGCVPCDHNSNAVLELGPQSFVQRADIEDNLRGTKRSLTRCANSKFPSCEISPNASNRISGECTNFVTVNPRLCDRSIVPTNLKFPVSKGF
jgi:hypothetical protein